jgi:hypothetical protein
MEMVFVWNENDQINFNLTYGGFDRVNNQFLWEEKNSGKICRIEKNMLIECLRETK